MRRSLCDFFLYPISFFSMNLWENLRKKTEILLGQISDDDNSIEYQPYYVQTVSFDEKKCTYFKFSSSYK